MVVCASFLVLAISCKKDKDEESLTVTDIDGNVYNTVTIGTQVWLKENLQTTKYRNGDEIGTTTPVNLDIYSETGPKYQWAYNGIESNVATYGRLYTWYVVNDSRGVCPTGWHVPTTAELETLRDFLGGKDVAGGMLKETGSNHWNSPNTGATNSTGFTALPGGRRDGGGNFQELGNLSCCWNSNQSDNYNAFNFFMAYNHAEVNLNPGSSRYGLSIRCIKD